MNLRWRPSVAQWLRFLLGVAAFLLFTAVGVSQTQVRVTPWTNDRLDAIVRIEVDLPHDDPSVGTGFIVNGKGVNYVVTSVHVIFGRETSNDDSATCIPLTWIVRFFRREREVEELVHNGCAWKLGSDIAMIPLPARSAGYPTLQMAAHEFQIFDQVFLAGYPNGYSLDPTRSGEVSTPRTPDGLVVANVATMEGMSGGPYLSIVGNVVGVHNGGVLYRANFAHFTSIERNRASIEELIGPIADEREQSPDLNALANEKRSSPELGTLIALRVIPDVELRIAVWQALVSREPSAEEETLLRQLPTTSSPELLASVGDQDFQTLSISSSGPVGATLLLESALSSASATAKQFCKAADITFEMGIMRCNGNEIYIPSSRSGGSNDPKLIVMHFTASPNLKGTIRFLLSQPNVSAHFLIDRDGTVVQMVPTDRAAAHAGSGSWNGFTNLNRQSIGIELINLGRLTKLDGGRFEGQGREVPIGEVEVVRSKDGVESYWHKYTGAQLAAAENVAVALAKAYHIQAIIGHCTISPNRKVDPGPAFPLDQFSQAVLKTSQEECIVN